jgi:ABC-type uncharacterized transport system permease subunit
MRSSSSFFAAAAALPLCFAAVPFTFTEKSVGGVLNILLPGKKINEAPPGQFGGCTVGEVGQITQAWNDAMNNIIPGAQTALAQQAGYIELFQIIKY